MTLGPLFVGTRGDDEGEPAMGQPLTIVAARRLALGVHQERARGKDVIADHDAAKRRRVTEREAASANSFGRAARKFVLDYARPKTRSWATSAKLLGLSPASLLPVPGGLCERWMTRPIASISAHDVHDLVDEIRRRGIPGLGSRREGVSDPQARVSHARLSKFFSWALSQRLVEKNPCAGVWRPDVEQARDRVLSDDEIRWFWEAAGSLGAPQERTLKLCLLSGARRGEVAGMTWDELDLDNRTWSLPASRVKNKRPHVIPLSDTALELIGDRPDSPKGFIFSTDGGRAHVQDWSKIKKKLDARMSELAGAPIPPWRIHDLRRTCASGLQRLGVRLEVTEAILNHVSGSFAGVVRVYQRHKYEPEKRAALERWAERVEQIVSGEPAKVVTLRRGKAS